MSNEKFNGFDGLPIGKKDKNGRMINNGDKVRVIKKIWVPVDDGWGKRRDDLESDLIIHDYIGEVFYNSERCEFRISREGLGSRNVYEFDSIEVVSSLS